ncbi:uncharacterized protein N7503_012003 [Penicillium pulvis]|uniref:uncharacterized protein n=1 Tax=Penicillium pulvis TaxID=1562058 RepID=UPI002546F43D|nr:uncharacterized protein N7503_012003 [Penicillium pulvis]KAJ5786791.1 hypothetical protein N7503_012003 [Penicillium pulvis]
MGISDNAHPSGSHEANDPITLQEMQVIARDKLPKHIYDFFASGSDNERALLRNEQAFDRLYIRPRVMVDVSDIDTSTKILGHRTSLPIGIAPSAMQRLAGGDGELDVAKAAVKMGLNLTLSSQSTTSLEDVAQTRQVEGIDESALPPFWMQLYLPEDPERSIDLIRRAEAARYQALVLTVDTPVLGNRLNERKTAVVLPKGMGLPNIRKGPPNEEGQASINRRLMDSRSAAEARNLRRIAGTTMHSSGLTWEKTIKFLRSVTKMKIILKGIMTAEDASLAVKYGVDGIIVSNHGGRQLNSASSTIEALPEIAAAVKNSIPIILDGGVRTGESVFKALALGADLILVGRPALWALAYKGQEGVEDMMNILERELNRTMALAGVTKISEITRDRLTVVSTDGFGLSKL